MTKLMNGVIHGRTIELDAESGIEDGRRVEITLRVEELPGPPPGRQPGVTETAAGMMADAWTPEDDRILEDIHMARKSDVW